MGNMATMDQRFWAKVEKSDDCWMWTGKKNNRGYGSVWIKGGRGREILAHRYSAMLRFGMFDRRLWVLHHCDTPLCIRPEHLYLGTHADNMRDMANRKRHPNGHKTHCSRGHIYDEENTYMHEGQRHCRVCNKETQRELRRKP